MRYFLDIAYKGTSFHGWQVQPNAHTVQAEIHSALSTLLQTKTECVGSGRTDTGVHARQQVCHFDAELTMPVDQFQYRLNSILPGEIAVNDLYPVSPHAHARFDAIKRTYHYHIHQKKNPFEKGLSYFYPSKINLKMIMEGLEVFKSWKNFQALSKVHTDVNHFDCDIFQIEWKQSNDQHFFCVSANRFLRGMVRAMMGTLLEMGANKLSSQELVGILEKGDRSLAGRSVPPDGLFLTEVSYPNTVFEK